MSYLSYKCQDRGGDRGTSVINVIILSPGNYVVLIAVLPRIIYERSYRKQARKEGRKKPDKKSHEKKHKVSKES